MPATRSEYREIKADATEENINMLLTLFSEFAEWPEAAKRWAGIAGDIEPRYRLERADFSNWAMSKLEQEIQAAKEAIAYHRIEYLSTTGKEAENHLHAINVYSNYIERCTLAMNYVNRQIGPVWPMPKYLQAALTQRREGGNRTPLPSADFKPLMEKLQKLQEVKELPPPPEDQEEAKDQEGKDNED